MNSFGRMYPALVNHIKLMKSGSVKSIRHRISGLTFLIFIILPIHSQTLITEDLVSLDQTPDELLMEYLQCWDMELISVKARAHIDAFGKFSAGNLWPELDNGLILTTGRVKSQGTEFGADALMEQFANVNSFGQTYVPAAASTMNEGVNVNAVVLEFSFIPHFDLLTLDYVFGSEEFADYTCVRGDDLMGIVISGLGYDYDPILKGELISVLPDSARTPIKVGSIHPETDFCAAENEGYYVPNVIGQQPVYSGTTIPFHQELPLVPGSIYTLQIFVTDNSDESKDSGLFLKMKATTDPFCNIDVPDPITLVEECSHPVNFSQPFTDFDADVFPLFWQMAGTADANVDYSINEVGGQIFSNNDSINLTIDVLADGEQEAVEEIILRLKTIDGNELDFVWFITDPLDDLSVSREVICGKRKTRVFIEGEQPSPNNYLYQIPAPYILERAVETVPLEVQGVPFDYLASPQNIAEVCVDINMDHSFDLYLVSPDEKRILLKFISTLTGIENFNTCLSTDAIHSIQYDYDDTALGFDVPFPGPYYPFHDWDRISGAKVNGVWRLEIIHSNNTAGEVIVNDFSITFRETGTPDLDFYWEDGSQSNEVDIVPFYYTSSGDFLNVGVQVEDCIWQDSIFMNRSSETEFYLEDSICHNDTINILGEPFFEGKEEKVFIYPNAIDCCCDSVLNYSIELINPAVNFQEAFVVPGQSFDFEDSLYSEGAYKILSNETSRFGCDSFIYLNVFPIREEYLPFEVTEFEDIDTLCIEQDKLGILEKMSPAIFHDYNILIQDTLFGRARDHSNAFGAESYRCFRMSTSSNFDNEIKRIANQLIDTFLSDTFYYATKWEFANVLNQITYPDLQWTYFESLNMTCPWRANVNLSNIRSYRYNHVLMDFTGVLWSSPTSEQIDNRLVLPVTVGDNQFVFQAQNGTYVDTINFLYTNVLPLGQADSLIIPSQPGQEIFYPLIAHNLCGPVETITQICEDNSTTAIAFNLDDDILKINTFDFGTRSICYELCDSLNICDTLIITVNAADPSAIEEMAEANIEIFPNPTSGLVAVNINNLISYKGKISIFNTQGVKVYYSMQSQNAQLHDLGELPPGFYLLQCDLENLLFLEKLIIHK